MTTVVTPRQPRFHWGRFIAILVLLGIVAFFWPTITSLGPRFWALRDRANSQATTAALPLTQPAAPAANANPVQVVPTVAPVTAASAPAAAMTSTIQSLPAITGEVFTTPVVATKVLNAESGWLLAEPGILLDSTATFDRGSSAGEHFVQCPEGGFAYFSMGFGNLSIDDVALSLEKGHGIINLVLVRCPIDDGNPATDRNITIRVTDYLAGNIITSPMGQGAFISLDWFSQQLEVATGTAVQNGNLRSDGNCGRDGCEPYVWLHDVDSNKTQVFKAESISNWTLIRGN